LNDLPYQEKWQMLLGLEADEEEQTKKSNYLIYDHSNAIWYWEILMSIPMWHSMCFNPLVIVWPDFHAKYIYYIWFFEMFWVADFFLSFFRAHKDFKTLKESSYRYLTGLFIFDMITTWPAFYSGQSPTLHWLKLFRVVHYEFFVKPVDLLMWLLVKEKHMRNNYSKLSNYLLLTLLFAHHLACVWLILGLRDQPPG
jgi:hypothetical protein